MRGLHRWSFLLFLCLVPVHPASSTDWNGLAEDELEKTLNSVPAWTQAKNVILFIGDGMGPTTVTAARAYLAQSRHLEDVSTHLAWENFPITGLSKTHNADIRVPDSAASATAMFAGEKVNYYTVGVNDQVIRGNCSNIKGNELKSLLKHAIDADKWAGLVTTTRVTHATPAAAYAHMADRDNEYHVAETVPGRENCPDSAQQLIHNPAAQKFRVIMGGGRSYMLPKTVEPEGTGVREDDRDLIQEWLDIKRRMHVTEEKYKYITTKQQLDDLEVDKIDYVLGLFADSHMDYELERKKQTPPTQPSLAEMVEKAIRMLSRSPHGFVLIVEGGLIDRAHHGNYVKQALEETVALSAAVERAAIWTENRETLTAVTADHSHAFSMAGYPLMADDILGTYLGPEEWIVPADHLPMLILGYQTGEGWYDHKTDGNGTAVLEPNPRDPLTPITRKNLTGVDTRGDWFRSDTLIPGEETHGGEDVGVYATGPSSYLFTGVHQQHYIAHVIMYSACIGRYTGDACRTTPAPSTPKPTDSGATTSNPVLWMVTLVSALVYFHRYTFERNICVF